jgi:hypothetical protein
MVGAEGPNCDTTCMHTCVTAIGPRRNLEMRFNRFCVAVDGRRRTRVDDGGQTEEETQTTDTQENHCSGEGYVYLFIYIYIYINIDISMYRSFFRMTFLCP